MKGIITYFILFILFSLLGFIFEVLCTRIINKKWINKGIFHGPIIPMYGIISLINIYLLKGYYNDLIVVLIFSMINGILIKYCVYLILKKIFYYKFWDCSFIKYNINGVINVFDLITFGIVGVYTIYIFEPLFLFLLGLIPFYILLYIFIFILLYFIIDLIISIISAKRSCTIAYNLDIILNEYTKSRNIKLNKIKTRLFKAYPYILNNNRLYQRLEKLKKDFKKKNTFRKIT